MACESLIEPIARDLKFALATHLAISRALLAIVPSMEVAKLFTKINQ